MAKTKGVRSMSSPQTQRYQTNTNEDQQRNNLTSLHLNFYLCENFRDCFLFMGIWDQNPLWKCWNHCRSSMFLFIDWNLSK
ncbi:hypothetical protein ACOSQ4_001395 [Xanthoceras sorbifolium]